MKTLKVTYTVTTEKDFDILDGTLTDLEVCKLEEEFVESLQLDWDEEGTLKIEWTPELVTKPEPFEPPPKSFCVEFDGSLWASDGAIFCRLTDEFIFSEKIDWKDLSAITGAATLLHKFDPLMQKVHPGVFDKKYCQPYLDCKCYGIDALSIGYIVRNDVLVALLMPLSEEASYIECFKFHEEPCGIIK